MATPRRYSWLYALGYLLFFAILWYSVKNVPAGPPPKQVSYSEFLAEVRAGHVDKVRIDQTSLTATLKKEDIQKDQPRRNPRRAPAGNRRDLAFAGPGSAAGHIFRSCRTSRLVGEHIVVGDTAAVSGPYIWIRYAENGRGGPAVP